jgi:hypothetical protein
MKKIIILLVSIAIIGCRTNSNKEEISGKGLADSLKFDFSIIRELQRHTSAEMEPFHYSLSREIHEDGSETEVDPIYLPGIVFKETAEETESLLEKLHDNFLAKGYTLFTLDRYYGIDGRPDVMAILKTADKYDVLSQIKTDGINYDIDNDSLVQIIKVLDAKYSLNLVGASGEWCEFRIDKEPSNWMTLANEAYAICPDIVDQGTGSVEALAEELKKSKRLFFWWD